MMDDGRGVEVFHQGALAMNNFQWKIEQIHPFVSIDGSS